MIFTAPNPYNNLQDFDQYLINPLNPKRLSRKTIASQGTTKIKLLGDEVFENRPLVLLMPALLSKTDIFDFGDVGAFGETNGAVE